MIARPRAALAALLVATAVAACTSAGDRFEQGLALEQSGQAVAAAQRYVQALHRDPAFPGARERLRDAGAQAVDYYLRQSEQDRLRGDPVRAAESFIAADGLLLSARGVQVILPVSDAYAGARRAALDDAISRLLVDGDALAAQARWQEAIDRYQQVSRFGPAPDQAARAAQGRAEALLRWGEAELAAGHYHSALAVAGRGLLETGGNSGYAQGFAELRRAALERGTVRVAFLPMAAAPHAADVAFLAEVDHALAAGLYERAPALIAPVDAARVPRARRGHHLAWDPAAAAGLARAIGADFVVVPVLDGLEVVEHGMREEARSFKTRDGRPIAYRVRTGTLGYRARARYRVVDASGNGPPREGAVDATHSARFEDALHPVDTRRLRLTPAERRTLEVGRDARAAAEAHLAGELAAKLSARALDDVLGRMH